MHRSPPGEGRGVRAPFDVRIVGCIDLNRPFDCSLNSVGGPVALSERNLDGWNLDERPDLAVTLEEIGSLRVHVPSDPVDPRIDVRSVEHGLGDARGRSEGWIDQV